MDAAATTRSERKLGRPTEADRVERRAQILDAALPVFLEYGFGNATVDRIAAAAQVTKRTLYTYFGNKDGVFTEMQRRLAEDVSGEVADDDTLQTLTTRIYHRLHSARMIGLHRLIIAESLRFPEIALSLHDNGDIRHITRLAGRIRVEVGDDAAVLAEPLFSLLLGENYRRRLLGLLPPATLGEAERHGRAALRLVGLVG